MPVLEGTAYWASVTTPNTNYEPVYSVNLVVDPEVASDFEDRGFTIKQMEQGPAVVIKRKVNGPNGMVRRAPKLLDQMVMVLKLRCNIKNGNQRFAVRTLKDWTSWLCKF